MIFLLLCAAFCLGVLDQACETHLMTSRHNVLNTNANVKNVVQPQPKTKVNPQQMKPKLNPNVPKPILKVDPVKKAANDQRNVQNLKKALAQTNIKTTANPMVHQPLPEKQKKEKKKKWYDKILDTADSVVKHLLPYAPLLLGIGDYKEEGINLMSDPPQTNTLLAAATNGKLGNEVPYMHSTGTSVRVPHREYVGDVYSTTSEFVTETFALNPGMNEVFTWLAPIANQFTSYKFGGIAAEFNSLASDYSDAAGLGYTCLATQYNVDEPLFDNKRDMLNSVFADSAKPSASFCSFIECSPEVVPFPKKFVRSGDLADNIDLNLYDHGRLTLAVGGNTEDDVAIGELYLTYDIELFLPRPQEEANFEFSAYTTSGVINSQPMGTGFSKMDGSTFGLSIEPSRITFPDGLRGFFYWEFSWTSSTPVVGMNPPSVTGVNCAGSNVAFGPSTVGTGSTGGVVSVARRGKVRVHRDGSYFDIGLGGTLVGATVTGSIAFYALPDGVAEPDFRMKIFDSKGKNRSAKYEEFMKQFKATPKSVWTDVMTTDNFIVRIKEDENKYKFCEKSDTSNFYPLSPKIFRILHTSTKADQVLRSLYSTYRGEFVHRDIEDLF